MFCASGSECESDPRGSGRGPGGGGCVREEGRGVGVGRGAVVSIRWSERKERSECGRGKGETRAQS